MLFTTPLFLYVFFPAFFLGYFLTPRSHRNIFAFLGSLIFYAWGEPLFVFVLIIALLIDYRLGLAIARHRLSDPSRSRLFLALGVSLNVGLFVYFKYTNFFLQNLSWLLHSSHPVPFGPLPILLPLGLSFFVFEEITYLVDLYRGVGHPAKTFLHYATYILLFPKLLAGPIIKYHDIEDQLVNRSTGAQDVAWGLGRFIQGLAKKVLIADALSPLVAKAFGTPPVQLEVGSAWIGIGAFLLQIYFDFSGYSDMAIGMARVMGFKLQENFNYPYLSTSFTDFWHRWHISLSTWIKSYLYIPLGGNRVSPARVYFNLLLCFLLCGLWHGANWTFVLWGLYNGFFLMAEKLFWLNLSRRLPRLLNQTLTLFLVALGLVFFRSATGGAALSYLSRLFALTRPTELGSQRVFLLGNSDLFILALGTLWVLLPLLLRRDIDHLPQVLPSRSLPVWKAAGFLLLLVLCLIQISASSFNPFIYFRF